MNNLNPNSTNKFSAAAFEKLMESDRQKAIEKYFDSYQVPLFIKKIPNFINTSEYRNRYETRGLSSYSIEASDDNSENNDNKILQLHTDEREWIKINNNVQAIRLSGCLLAIHIPDNADFYNAWHFNGVHRAMLSDNLTGAMCMMSDPVEVYSAYREAGSWREMLSKYPGTSYLCATDDVSEQIRRFFRVSPANITKTGGLDVDVTFDSATRTFQVNHLLEVEAADSKLESP